MVEVQILQEQKFAPVAQLDRVPGFEPGGREFESLRARQILYYIQELVRCSGRRLVFTSIKCRGFCHVTYDL